MAELRFSPESLLDLQEIRDYITMELSNPSAAKRTVSGILDNVKILSDFPQIGSPLSVVTGFETDYRFLVCGNYMTFYRMENDMVNIIRILYGRRNFMEILFGNLD